MILFGSAVADRFALDTVFVVRKWIDHDRETYHGALSGYVPDAYWDVTLAPWYPPEQEERRASESYRLYFGATYDQPFEEMFSFFPCRPADSLSSGFARPIIDIPGAITPNLRQGKRLNPQANLRDAAELWSAVAGQVQAQSLALGIWAQMPPRQ